jgi:hypothetical protein
MGMGFNLLKVKLRLLRIRKLIFWFLEGRKYVLDLLNIYQLFNIKPASWSQTVNLTSEMH